MTEDTFHIAALYNRLRNEKAYLAAAKTDREIALRTVWIEQIKNELRAEGDPLGLCDECDMSADELLAELLA
jgi:hypothetical protein